MKEIRIIKNRSDIGAGTRGADMGIDAIEIAAINKQNKYFDTYSFEDVETENESIYNKVNNSPNSASTARNGSIFFVKSQSSFIVSTIKSVIV